MRFRSLQLLMALVVAVAMALPRYATAGRFTQAPDAPVASYRMDVRLDPATKTVTGNARITYRNPSDDRLNELWLRLYLRAFSSPDTVWMRESGGGMRGYAFNAASMGDITLQTLTLANGTDLLATATFTDTLVRVPLPQSLAPGQTIDLDARWTTKLPRVFARTGYGGRDDTFFMVGQWYPKLAVYDRGRWDTEPWHARAEFFHDFGDYEVRLTVPRDYVVAGAGVPAGEPEVRDGMTTQRWVAQRVTDWAFAASPDFKVRMGRAADTEVVLYYLPEHTATVDEYLETSTGALQTFNQWFGAYPHPRLTVVDVPDNAGGAGGMEYPTLITGGNLGAPAGSGLLSVVVAHEIAHQWWPMQTATNEAREPWLDEGLTQYSGSRYLVEAGRGIGFGTARISAAALDRLQYAVAPEHAATLPAWDYSEVTYGATVYSKTALGLWTLENVVGAERLHQALRTYLERYRWRHPTGAEFRASLEQSLDADLGWLFDVYLATDGVIDYAATPIGTAPDGNAVRIERLGDVPAPVEVRITTASGRQETRRWDGREPSATFTVPGAEPVVRVEVDPARKLQAELDVVNNGASTSVRIGSATTVSGRLAFWTQFIAQLLGLFG